MQRNFFLQKNSVTNRIYSRLLSGKKSRQVKAVFVVDKLDNKPGTNAESNEGKILL